MPAGKKVLIVCMQEIIEERDDGGKKGSYRIYELFKKVFGEENVVLCMYTNHNPSVETPNILRIKSHKNLAARCMNIMGGHLFSGKEEERNIVRFIEKNKVDIVLLDRSLHGKLAKELKRKTKCEIWVFMHNIERNYFRNRVKHENILFFFPYLVIVKSEKETIAHADYIMGLNQRDAQIVRKLYDREVKKILPTAFYDEFDIAEKKETENQKIKKELLFIGTMFPPNYEGIKWFIKNVMSELPDVTLKIVGKNFEKKREELEKNNVEVVGTVNNLQPYYYAKNVIVMPIFYGDGIKVKTAEAMMYGKIILAADEALVGYEVDGVDGIYRCNSKEEFIRCINGIFAKGVFYSESVRNCFLDKYCLDKQIEECRIEWLSGCSEN